MEDSQCGFSALDPNSFPRAEVEVGKEIGILVDSVPSQLSWRIVFVKHGENLYRLMYWLVEIPEAKVDIDELYQTTINAFAFIKY
jgi:hypothetical protein